MEQLFQILAVSAQPDDGVPGGRLDQRARTVLDAAGEQSALDAQVGHAGQRGELRGTYRIRTWPWPVIVTAKPTFQVKWLESSLRRAEAEPGAST